jgi:hypothetical protein
MAPYDGYILPTQWDSIRRFYRAAGYGYLGATSAKFKYGTFVDMSYYRAGIGKPKPRSAQK